MLTARQLERYADVLLWGLQKARTGRYKSNDIIMVRYNLPALPLAEILYARILDRKAHPVMRPVITSNMEKMFFARANPNQLVFEPPGERLLYKNLHGNIFLHAPESLMHLQHADPSRIARAALARKPLRDILIKREEHGQFGWTLCSFPTASMARHAGTSFKDYCTQVIKACYLSKPDPVSAWDDIYRSAQSIKKWLNSLHITQYHIESRSTDLKIAHGEKRRWVGISGHNIPSFELFISPDWRTTSGVFFADQPSYRSGNLVKGVRLEFRNGSVVRADADAGSDFVAKQLAMDPGAGRLGEFSLTDTRFSKIDRFMADTLYDENFGGRFGNCHIALGSSYSDTFSGNPALLTKSLKKQLGFNDSALHWDLVNTEHKTVTALLRGGKRMVIYEKGMFTY